MCVHVYALWIIKQTLCLRNDKATRRDHSCILLCLTTKTTIKRICCERNKSHKRNLELYSLNVIPVTSMCCAKSLQLYLMLCDPMGLQPARLLCPWDSPGKNSGVNCHLLLQSNIHVLAKNISDYVVYSEMHKTFSSKQLSFISLRHNLFFFYYLSLFLMPLVPLQRKKNLTLHAQKTKGHSTHQSIKLTCFVFNKLLCLVIQFCIWYLFFYALSSTFIQHLVF